MHICCPQLNFPSQGANSSASWREAHGDFQPMYSRSRARLNLARKLAHDANRLWGGFLGVDVKSKNLSGLRDRPTDTHAHAHARGKVSVIFLSSFQTSHDADRRETSSEKQDCLHVTPTERMHTCVNATRADTRRRCGANVCLRLRQRRGQVPPCQPSLALLSGTCPTPTSPSTP